MTIDYDKIVKGFNIGKLTKKKITASFIRKNFKEEIADLRMVLTFGNGDMTDNELEETVKVVLAKSEKPEVTNQQAIPMQSLFMGQEMTTEIWIGYVQSLLNGEFIRTVNNNGQITLVTYDKTEVQTEPEKVALATGDIPEKEIVSELKKALLKRF